MSAETVQAAILKYLRGVPACESEFSTALTGTLSSDGAAVTGAGTAFLTEVSVGDYIGIAGNGYRRVTAVTGDGELQVEAGFDAALDASSCRKTEIRPGFKKNESIGEVGRLLRVVFSKSSNLEDSIGANRVRAIYGFLLVVGFIESDPAEAEKRKSGYDKMLRDAVETDFTFGGLCLGNTSMGSFQVVELPNSDGIYYGVMPLVCSRHETRGNR